MKKVKREKQSHLIYATRNEKQKSSPSLKWQLSSYQEERNYVNRRRENGIDHERGRNEEDLIGLSMVQARLASSLAFSLHQPY